MWLHSVREETTFKAFVLMLDALRFTYGEDYCGVNNGGSEAVAAPAADKEAAAANH